MAADEPTLRLRIQKGFKGGSSGFPWGERMSEGCRDVISLLLVKVPSEERLSARQVLEHHWVSEHCTPGKAAPPAPGAEGTASGTATESGAGFGGAAAAAVTASTYEVDGGGAIDDSAGDAVDERCSGAANNAVEDAGIEDDEETGEQPHWWCDVADEGCLRPEQPTRAGQYDPRDRCWAHPDGQYMVCESCYEVNEAVEHRDVLRLLEGFGV